MADAVTTEALRDWLRRFAALVADNRDHLTELDAAIGDADHGSNMDRGMKAVVAALDPPPETPSALFTLVGRTLVSTVGGASGPLFGTFFLRLGGALRDVGSPAAGDLATALRAGLTGVADRGKAEPGDKTMLDALAPAVDALETSLAGGGSLAAALGAAYVAAEAGRDATTPMVAHKGRASYLGERSAGHQDPGATSVALLLQAASEAIS